MYRYAYHPLLQHRRAATSTSVRVVDFVGGVLFFVPCRHWSPNSGTAVRVVSFCWSARTSTQNKLQFKSMNVFFFPLHAVGRASFFPEHRALSIEPGCCYRGTHVSTMMDKSYGWRSGDEHIKSTATTTAPTTTTARLVGVTPGWAIDREIYPTCSAAQLAPCR